MSDPIKPTKGSFGPPPSQSKPIPMSDHEDDFQKYMDSNQGKKKASASKKPSPHDLAANHGKKNHKKTFGAPKPKATKNSQATGSSKGASSGTDKKKVDRKAVEKMEENNMMLNVMNNMKIKDPDPGAFR
jgi:hypothetical protein